jgi:hypothetical protein
MSALAVVIIRKQSQPCGFAKFEFVGSLRAAWTKQPLPFGGTGNVFDVPSIAIIQSALFKQILHVAVGALEIQSGSRHGA